MIKKQNKTRKKKNRVICSILKKGELKSCIEYREQGANYLEIRLARGPTSQVLVCVGMTRMAFKTAITASYSQHFGFSKAGVVPEKLLL